MNKANSLIIAITLLGLTTIASANTLTTQESVSVHNENIKQTVSTSFNLGAPSNVVTRFNKIKVSSKQFDNVENASQKSEVIGVNLGAHSESVSRFNKIHVGSKQAVTVVNKKQRSIATGFNLGAHSETVTRFNKIHVLSKRENNVTAVSEEQKRIVSKGFNFGASS